MRPYFRQNTPWSDPVPRVRGQRQNFTICPVTTIKIRLYPRDCRIVHEVVGWGRETGYSLADFARTLHHGVMTGRLVWDKF